MGAERERERGKIFLGSGALGPQMRAFGSVQPLPSLTKATILRFNRLGSLTDKKRCDDYK
jgi:hypothetical protein